MSRSPVMRRRITVLRAWMRIEWTKAVKEKKDAGLKKDARLEKVDKWRLMNRDQRQGV